MELKNEPLPILGIIAGGGSLPSEIAKVYDNLGGKYYLAAIDESYTNFAGNKNNEYQSFKIGEVKKLINYLKSCNVVDIVFVGNIQRPNISSIKVDMYGAILVAKILQQKLAGDNQILQIVANFFENKGFRVISACKLLNLNQQNKFKTTTIISPNKQDIIDIEIGFKVANTIGLLDIGQAVVIEDGYILGVEAAEGTDQLIERCAQLRKKAKGGVLVKIMKKNQDKRLDIPTVGTVTIEKLASFGYNGIAIEENNVIIANPKNTIALANELKIFIKGSQNIY
ncbi:MAG: DUF1009 domain-containing protein [Rickettsiaceae bacterium]|nr:MAG: DUF1009 domain-containing protein [Rickettsiaceae bacterium]